MNAYQRPNFRHDATGSMVFERVISLGALCQTTYQIRERFGFNTSSPFDWLVTSLSALKLILRTNGARFGLAVHSEIGGAAGLRKGHTVFCSEYRVAYQHEFIREDNRNPVMSEEALETCRGKLLHKYRKMHQTLLENRPTLFIRFAGHHDGLWLTPNVDDQRPVLADELNELADIISAKYPALPFRIAFVTLGPRTTLFDTGLLDPRIVSIRLDETTGEWPGDKEEWNKVFSRFTFDLSAAEHAGREYLF